MLKRMSSDKILTGKGAKAALLLLFVFTPFLFQSCGPKTPFRGESDSAGALGEVILTINSNDLDKITFNAQGIGLDGVNSLHSYSLDANSKILSRLNADGLVVETCSPDLEPIETVINTLHQAEVCEYPGNTDPNRQCTLIYTPAYATLHLKDRVEIPLGERTSGCGGMTNLCSIEKQIQLKDNLKDLLSSAFGNGSCGT